MIYTTLATKLGELVITTDDGALTGVSYDRIPAGADYSPNDPLLIEARVQITQYLAGELREFKLRTAARGTQFQRSVWKALSEISYGQTLSYRELAKRIGHETAVRAVGNALGRNPLVIVLPCHRVLSSSGQIGGYAGGLERKRQLLRIEGVQK